MSSKRKPWSRQNEKNTSDGEEELLVFGYSCKLFRDDEKALYIEQGKHLIPWMGDDRLMIDRYDGRGYLHDLEHFEAKSGQVAHMGLTEEEIKVEALCDEERYHSLYKDIAEEEMYHEEEMKRLRKALASEGAYNEVCFTYNEESNTKDSTDSTEPPEEPTDTSEEQPFIAPPEMGLPEGMEVPPTVKMNAIIEKTAVFVAQQGLQMEIVIKTKQSKNSQFSFMQFDHPLNPYYKYMISCIKSGKYKPASQEKSKRAVDDDEEDDDDDDSHYLHPSLLANKTAAPVTQIPKIQYVSGSEDDYYSLLVKQLKGKVKSSGISDNNSSTNNTPPSGTQSPNVLNNNNNNNNNNQNSNLQSINSFIPVDPSLPPPPGLEPVTLPPPPPPPPPATEEKTPADPPVKTIPGVESQGTVATTSSEKWENRIIPPTPDIQPIIDKMACYVAKNGKDFEMVVLNKGDKRFDFLHEWHELNPYYLFKKSLFEQQLVKEKRQHALELAEEIAKRKLKEKAARAAAAAAAVTATITATASVPPPPVSFSIKAKDPEVGSVDKRNALQLGDESSESETGDSEKKEQMEETRRVKESRFDKIGPAGPIIFETVEKPSARMKNEILEARLAEERIKDRLAASARDKLSSASREKLLQMERKKRAALFLNMIKKDKNVVGEEQVQPVMIGPQLPEVMVVEQPTSVLNLYGSQKKFEYKKTRGRDSRSRSRSPSYHKRSRRSRSRSRQRSRFRSRSKSPKKSKKAKTPPAAYSVVRRSRSSSPHRHGSRHRSRSTSHERSYKRSSRGKYDYHSSSSSSSRNRNRHSRSSSKSRSYRRRGSSHSRSRSRSPSKSSRSPVLPKIEEKCEKSKSEVKSSRSSSPEFSEGKNNSS